MISTSTIELKPDSSDNTIACIKPNIRNPPLLYQVKCGWWNSNVETQVKAPKLHILIKAQSKAQYENLRT